ncbi:hypothetical protein ECSTECDG1313_2482 [Escherichia coli STEC_DG131-3]|nr:hypothetical protein ECSTECDG1313_2482 [Escherichia coli STEC_DG131-3]
MYTPPSQLHNLAQPAHLLKKMKVMQLLIIFFHFTPLNC